MRFERIKNNKKILFMGIVSVLIGVTVILVTSLSVYKKAYTIEIAKGDVTYILPDFQLIAVNVEKGNSDEYDNIEDKYEISQTVPSGYSLNSELSKCYVNNEEVAIGIYYDNENISFSNMNTKGTKCYLYFDRKETISIDDLITSKTILPSRTDFSEPFTQNTNGKVYSIEDNDGTAYYYAGNVTDNYLQFGGYNWRILRVTGSGNLRIMMESKIGSDFENIIDVDVDDYDYGLLGIGNHAEAINYFYENAFEGSSLQNYVYDYNEIMASCVDDEIATVSNQTYTITNVWGDAGASTLAIIYYRYNLYEPYNKVINHTPNLLCSTWSELLYYSIITADEVMLAGGGNFDNDSYFLNYGREYATISKAYDLDIAVESDCDYSENCEETGGADYEATLSSENYFYAVNENGKLMPSIKPSHYYPVIELGPGTVLSGSGTKSDPYIPGLLE